MRGIDIRLDRLEELLHGRAGGLAVIRQCADGTWPPDPPGASLAIAIKSFQYEAGAAAPNPED